MNAELFQAAKNYLDMTWADVDEDKKLLGILQRGIVYLNKITGSDLDYSIEDTPRALLFDYSRYVRANALEEFQTNYLHELLSLQITEEAKRYAASIQ